MKRWLLIFFVMLLALVAIAIASLPALLETDAAQAHIREQIHMLFPQEASVGKVRLRYFPWPHVHVTHVEVAREVSDGQIISLKAATIDVAPRIVKVLLRKLEFSRLTLAGGELRYQFKWPSSNTAAALTLNDLVFRATNVDALNRAKGRLSARLFGEKENFHTRFHYTVDAKAFRWNESKFALHLSFQDIDLPQAQSSLLPSNTGYIEKGHVSGSVHVEKVSGDTLLRLGADLSVSNISYRLYGEEFQFDLEDAKLHGEMAYDVSSKILNIQDVSLESSAGDATLRGSIDLSKNLSEEGLDLELSSPAFNLDAVPKSLPGYNAKGIEWSGVSRFSVLLRGGTERFLAKTELNMTDGSIRMSDTFYKPEHTVLEGSGQFNRAEEGVLKGDFELRFMDAVTKGSLVEWRPATKDYEVTFLSNKFGLNAFPDAFPALGNYTFDGQVKWLLNIKGNADTKRIDHVRTHLTLDKISVGGKDGYWVEHVQGLIDFQDRNLWIKDVRGQWENLPISISGEALGMRPSRFTLLANVGEGTVQANGALDVVESLYQTSASFEAKDISLSDVLSRASGQRALEGAAHAKGVIKLQGRSVNEFISSMSSEGHLRLENGKLNTIDLMAALNAIEKLVLVAADREGVTEFTVLEADYAWQNAILRLSEGYLQSERFGVGFSGTVSNKAGFNMPIDIFLSPKLSRRIMSGLNEGEVMKVPAHLSGPIGKPKIDMKSALVRSAVSSLVHEWTDGRFGERLLKTTLGGTPSSGGTFSVADEKKPDSSSPITDKDYVSSRAPIGESDLLTPQANSGSEATAEEQLVRAGIGILSGLFGEPQRKN